MWNSVLKFYVSLKTPRVPEADEVIICSPQTPLECWVDNSEESERFYCLAAVISFISNIEFI